MWLVVGLGNPGKAYEETRHNVGFMLVDRLCEGAYQTGFSSFYASIKIHTQSVVLLKPQTFMNRSGTAVQSACAFYKIPLSQVLVVHDDLDLPMGEVRLKMGGGHGGHNGLRDIDRLLGAGFIRLRMGIGRPKIKGTEADYVLSAYSGLEKDRLNQQLILAQKTVYTIFDLGFEKAQFELHNRRKIL